MINVIEIAYKGETPYEKIENFLNIFLRILILITFFTFVLTKIWMNKILWEIENKFL